MLRASITLSQGALENALGTQSRYHIRDLNKHRQTERVSNAKTAFTLLAGAPTEPVFQLRRSTAFYMVATCG